MERPLLGALFAACMLTSAACVIVDTDGDLGGDSSVGGEGTGNTSNNGGNGGDISTGGSGGSSNNTGGNGGGVACDDFTDCADPGIECYGASCEENGFCGAIPLPPGQLCSTGVCDGIGSCVECVDETDCDNGDVCDQGVCSTTQLGGVCGDNLCQLQQASGDCVSCVISEGGTGGQCETEYSECIADGTSAACTTCLDYFGGEGGENFCAGSAEIIQSVLNCMCTPGVCAE